MNLFITIIIITKLLFIILSLIHIYLKKIKKTNSDLDKKILFLKERIEFIFILFMSILLIHLFNPFSPKSVEVKGETKLLLFLFGIILIISANWNTFIGKSIGLKMFQSIFVLQ